VALLSHSGEHVPLRGPTWRWTARCALLFDVDQGCCGLLDFWIGVQFTVHLARVHAWCLGDGRTPQHSPPPFRATMACTGSTSTTCVSTPTLHSLQCLFMLVASLPPLPPVLPIHQVRVSSEQAAQPSTLIMRASPNCLCHRFRQLCPAEGFEQLPGVTCRPTSLPEAGSLQPHYQCRTRSWPPQSPDLIVTRSDRHQVYRCWQPAATPPAQAWNRGRFATGKGNGALRRCRRPPVAPRATKSSRRFFGSVCTCGLGAVLV